MEPRYVDDDEVEKPWMFTGNLMYPKLAEDFMSLVGRKSCRFVSEAEFNKWHKVESAYDRGILEDGWLDECQKVIAYRASQTQVPNSMAWVSAIILNMAKQDVWRSKIKRQY